MATNYPINPRVRAFGKARIDIARRAKNLAQWEKIWKHPANSFPFVWGESWKQSIEYRVDDFAAEVGFYIDILGLPINALDPGYAMFTSPQGDFFFSVVPTPPNNPSTPPDAFRLQFMVKDIVVTTQELQRRGIDFEQSPQTIHPGSSLSIASFRTPHGICVELWGRVDAGISEKIQMDLSIENNNGYEEEDESDDDLEESEGNSDDDEGELEGEEEIGGDADDDGLGEDLEGEEDEDDFQFDEDEDDEEQDDEDDDEFNGDEDFIPLKPDYRISGSSNSPTQPGEAKLVSPDRTTGNNNKLSPEYINLDVP